MSSDFLLILFSFSEHQQYTNVGTLKILLIYFKTSKSVCVLKEQHTTIHQRIQIQKEKRSEIWQDFKEMKK